MAIFVNRILNMKRIKAIGFDMDYTLVRYHTENFERLTYQKVLEKLVKVKKYPKEILGQEFKFNQVIQGLVIDRKQGNILKVSRFGNVKYAVHGTRPLSYSEQQEIYRSRFIDLNDENIQSLDTSFSISNGVLYGQLVDLKNRGVKLPSFEKMSYDIKEIIDLAHSDGSLKGQVRKSIEDFIIQDESVAPLLERFKRYGKKLLLITNSDYHYCKLLMDYTINPFLKDYKDWKELFDITITLSSKPRFFTSNETRFLTVNPESGLMSNFEGTLSPGVYQGGSAQKLQQDLELEGEDILYLGDHIYGDVVSIKKASNWRTGMVLDPLFEEIESIKKSQPIQNQINALMEKKEELEHHLNKIDLKKNENKAEVDRKELNKLFSELETINSNISQLLEEFKTHFNPNWGEMMRAGQEESRFADQVEKYACIYMSKVSDLIDYSPKVYFRPKKRSLPHEV